MSAITATIALRTNASIRPSLKDEVLQRGGADIDIARVKRYQQEQVHKARSQSGWWGKHWVFAWTVQYTATFVPLAWALFAAINCVGFVMKDTLPSSELAQLLPDSAKMTYWMFASLGGAVVSLLIGFALASSSAFKGHSEACSHWRRRVLFSTKEESLSMPARLQLISESLRTIPDVQIEIDTLAEDPFVYAVRGVFREERICYGYWDAPGFTEHD